MEQIIEEVAPEPEAMEEEAAEDLFEEATIKESTPDTTETMDAPAEEEVIAEYEEQAIEEATVVPEEPIQEEDTNQEITGCSRASRGSRHRLDMRVRDPCRRTLPSVTVALPHRVIRELGSALCDTCRERVPR